jgi:transposase-like protein
VILAREPLFPFNADAKRRHGADRRNGSYRRWLLTELGDIELSVPRTRRYCPTDVVRDYARRSPEIDRTILAGFVLGLSTRKLGEVLLCLLGRPVSPTTVSRVAQSLDRAVAAFHARALNGRYQVLMLDGIVLARKTGAQSTRNENDCRIHHTAGPGHIKPVRPHWPIASARSADLRSGAQFHGARESGTK